MTAIIVISLKLIKSQQRERNPWLQRKWIIMVHCMTKTY